MSEELLLVNSSDLSRLREEFERCCGSPIWVNEMIRNKPFTSIKQLLEEGNQVWWNLSSEGWLKAFAAHPKINKQSTIYFKRYDDDLCCCDVQGDRNALRAKFSQHSWEGNEQSGTNTATEEILEALEILIQEYELRHGFIFIICATGKSAMEMLDALKARLNNDTVTEVQNAAGEQAKIIRLRLLKLLQSFSSIDSHHQLSKL